MNDTRAVSDRSDYVVAASRRRVYKGVRDLLQGSGCPANVYEVADTVGAQVSHRLRVLEASGGLPASAGFRFAAWDRRAGYHPALYVEPDDVPGEVTFPSRIGGTVLVPVCGWIPAGPLNLANQVFESAFLLDKRSIGTGTFFMLKVVGDSMIGAGITDGDWVVVRQQEDARNGATVAAMVDGDVTVKTLHREPGLLELVPQNPDYEPIPVTELTLLGTVVGVVRQADSG